MRSLAVLLCSLVVLAPSAAWSMTFTDLFFFGASGTDTGNNSPSIVMPLLGLDDAALGYDPDRWTENGGSMWSETFATALGHSGAAQASAFGGNNYARGGDTADEIQLQITSLSTDVGGSLDGGALYAIWGGGNDLLQGDTAANAASDVINAINSLSALGAQHFLVLNQADFSPLAPGTGPLGGVAPIPPNADIWSTDFNNALSLALAGLGGVSIYEYDVASVLNPLVQDPVGSGFSEGLNLCADDTDCQNGIGTADFLMMDHVHMMSAAHDLIAAGAFAAVVPEPSTGVLLGLGLGLLAARRR